MGKWMDDKLRFSLKFKSGTNDECWEWQKTLDKDGYGRFWVDGKNQAAHRYAYFLYNGTIDDNLLVMHTCDNPPCVNPHHLKQGTVLDNNRDMFAKGRNRRMNGEKNPMGKLTAYQVKKIRELDKVGLSGMELSRMFNISRRQIYNIVHQLHWKDRIPAEAAEGTGTANDATILVEEYTA